jgi:hypothetical protein
MEELLLIIRKYETDYGLQFYFPTIKISIIENYDDSEVSRGLSELIPNILQKQIIANDEEDVNICELPKSVKPRWANFDVLNRRKSLAYRAKIEYPFRPGSPEWETFWRQLRSFDFIDIRSHGEFVGNPTLKLLAGRDVCSCSDSRSVLERLTLPRFNGGF